MKQPLRVSVHGGHSGQFCNHARDSLEEIVCAYIAQGFSWCGITEHMAAVKDCFTYADEQQAGLDAEALQLRFREYFKTCANLKKKYEDQIELLMAFETETYSGSEVFIRQILSQFNPDYIVGSLHHVGDRAIDFSESAYKDAADAFGGLDNLYCRYFDEQYDMIIALKPDVVGHFDLIRIFDCDYKDRLKNPAIQQRVDRNLNLIKEQDSIVDFNLAGFAKPAAEPYPTTEILVAAINRGISIVPGDDSHSVATVGQHYERGIDLLRELGADLTWEKPARHP